MDTKIGIVKGVKDGYATVELKRNSACGSCEACSMKCNESSIDIIVKNNLNAKSGDRVSISAEEGVISKALILLYFIPFALLMAGVIGGWYIFKSSNHREAFSVLLGIVFMSAGFITVHFKEKKLPDKEIFVMHEII